MKSGSDNSVMVNKVRWVRVCIQWWKLRIYMHPGVLPRQASTGEHINGDTIPSAGDRNKWQLSMCNPCNARWNKQRFSVTTQFLFCICATPWIFPPMDIGLNMLTSDYLMSCLHSLLGYSTGEFQALHLSVLGVCCRGLTTCLLYIGPLC